MVSKVRESPTPWRSITICGTVAIAIPILYYGHLYMTARTYRLTVSALVEVR